MTGHLMRVASLVALLALSCGGPQRSPPDHAIAAKPIPLKIWIDPASHLSEGDTLIACEEWRSKGIRCYLTDDKAESDVQVYAAEEKRCLKNKDGTRTLALAWRGGRIVFNMGCFGKNRHVNRHKFRAVMTHEIGHQLGIWNHVPPNCDTEGVKRHPSGERICGKAVMNPMYDKDVWAITHIDSLAFDVRDPLIAVVVDIPSDDAGDMPDCVYLDR